MIIGIDPGAKGGLCALIDGEIAMVETMPATIADCCAWLRRTKEIYAVLGEHTAAYVEHVHAMPHQGVTSMFTFGTNYGALLGILASLNIPCNLVSPRTWQKTFWGKTANPKLAALKACKRLYPAQNLLASERCKKPHDGIVDAILIARYGHDKEKGVRHDNAI